jgi:AraC-like DNA-binding protein
MGRYIPITQCAELTLGEYRCEPSETCGWSNGRADFDEWVFVRQGLFLIEADGRTLVGSPNHLIRLRSGTRYRVRHPHGGGDECLVIGLVGRRELIAASSSVPVRPWAYVQHLRVVELARRNRAAEALELEELLCNLPAARVESPTNSPPTPWQRRLAIRALELVSSDCSQHWTLSNLASQLACSPFHLARVFRHVLGHPIHRYVTALRLKEALRRQLEGEKELARLAVELGFFDHAHLTNSYRREFGFSPSRLRDVLDSKI